LGVTRQTSRRSRVDAGRLKALGSHARPRNTSVRTKAQSPTVHYLNTSTGPNGPRLWRLCPHACSRTFTLQRTCRGRSLHPFLALCRPAPSLGSRPRRGQLDTVRTASAPRVARAAGCVSTTRSACT
jgi:hypothetical protein